VSDPSAPTANAVVLGCGRSGTSIFGELFAALPGFRYWSARRHGYDLRF